MLLQSWPHSLVRTCWLLAPKNESKNRREGLGILTRRTPRRVATMARRVA